MNYRTHKILVATGLLTLGLSSYGQVQNNGVGQYRLDPANPPANFTIGDAYTAGSALNVRGDLMGTPTGEVFRTDAPNTSTTSWRLFRGSTEYGRLFNEVANTHFTQNAPEGHLRWQTNNLLRMQLNMTQNNTINGFTVPTDGFLGLGRATVGGTAPGTPWTRLHLHDLDAGAGVVTLGFRDWMRNGMTITGHGDHMYVVTSTAPVPAIPLTPFSTGPTTAAPSRVPI